MGRMGGGEWRIYGKGGGLEEMNGRDKDNGDGGGRGWVWV